MKLVIAIIVLAAIVLPLLPDGTGDVVGRIRIPRQQMKGDKTHGDQD